MTRDTERPPARLVVLGVDAASPELLDRWIGDGTLPNLRALAERGLVARTRGVEGFFIGSTWPSAYTGTSPAKHGVHYLLQLVPGTYALHRVADAAFVTREPFWRAVSRAGMRVAVLDVPLTRLDESLNGVQVVEWGGHDALYGFRTHPRELARELTSRHGSHPLGPSCDGARRSADDYAALVERLTLGARRKGEWTRELLARGGWDLFVQVFTEAHCAGHQCWHLHDAAHPAHDPAVVARTGDPLERVYRAVDDALGDVLAAAGTDTHVVVFSAHGMSHWFGAQFLLREILLRLSVTVADRSRERGAPSLARRLWHALPEVVRRPVRALLRAVRPTPPTHAIPSLAFDPARSRCFPLNNGLAVGGIRLNLVGREPQGVLRPGAEAQAFCDELAADLLAIVDERTGAPLVRRVLRTDDLYAGEARDALPDLLVEWSDDVPTGSTALAGGAAARVRARSPKIGVVEGANDYGRTGEHRPGGWLLAAGPGIAPGRLDRVLSPYDLAPTLTAMLGVELPDSDGAPVPEIVRRDAWSTESSSRLSPG
ncbi:type I phosphodiesterase/nucleotide pyrophosphatase [Gemmatirosa kalamazoonensis]|uniref:Type I phosphodiesterase/nucleotide pyrophosphatase n=1 Tax=Gemmatirosa kalamazoonensis TaxID=861299 RepID=W0RHQ3_9BACT|nr:alkaline phosphatase family protein [Gemmatirosa kalamazoonensis]AHG89957.1 type I phosphodiesterase/nucleotide pyrophosphatase [Gemmatirosa kalamazoonensis]